MVFAIGALNAITIPQQMVTEHSYELLSAGGFHICAGNLLNTESCIFLIVLMIISLIVQIYSYINLQNKKIFNLCFFFMNLLNFAFTGLVLAPNLIQFFVFEVMTGIIIYVLSSLYDTSDNKTSIWFLIYNALSDIALLSGIILFSYISVKYMDLSPVEFLSFNALDNFKDTMDVILYPEVYTSIVILFVIYAGIKMLLFPFQQWLCSVNKNISPFSLYVNSLFIAFSGIYLLIKLYPLIPETMLDFIVYAGIITALISVFILTAQKDIRKILSYIISVQTGLIAVLIGSGAINFVVISSVVFVFISVLQTAIVNEIIDITKETDKDKICGIKHINYPLSVYWLISALSVSGICFGGFTQKDLIIKVLKLSENNLLLMSVIIVCFLISYVCFRFYYDIFEGGNNQYKCCNNKYKTTCFMILCLFVVLPGFMFNISNTKIFITDLIISLISILAVIMAYTLYKAEVKSIFPSFINNIAEKEIYIPNVFDFIHNCLYSVIGWIYSFDKYVIDKVFKYLFMPFSKFREVKNIRIQKIWLLLYIIIILCITFGLYNCAGRMY
jgi:NADH:ubiquinone oxidoreductase subunit 5 (subunit L)/multisubunit Na+/H+ antiporter MnhA subunit